MLNFVDLPMLAALVALLLGLAVSALALSKSTRSGAGGVRAPGRARPALRGRARVIGSYALLNRLGAGAMGVVYRARHIGTGQLCAVKLLPRTAGERERRQFDNEVRHGARVRHPNAVRFYEEGKAADGTRFFAMELVDGISLQELVDREGPQPASRVIPILLQTCAALGAAHAQGLVHRDVKPSNIVVSRGADGRDSVKLLDFGLVKHRAEHAGTGAEEPVVGTPLYISPEAITSPGAVDGRSDLYGLGAVAHFMLSGAPVFDGQTVIEVCSQHLSSAPEALSNIVGWELGADLEALVLDCLAKDPSARPADAAELARRLAGCADAERHDYSSAPALPFAPYAQTSV